MSHSFNLIILKFYDVMQFVIIYFNYKVGI